MPVPGRLRCFVCASCRAAFVWVVAVGCCCALHHRVVVRFRLRCFVAVRVCSVVVSILVLQASRRRCARVCCFGAMVSFMCLIRVPLLLLRIRVWLLLCWFGVVSVRSLSGSLFALVVLHVVLLLCVVVLPGCS